MQSSYAKPQQKVSYAGGYSTESIWGLYAYIAPAAIMRACVLWRHEYCICHKKSQVHTSHSYGIVMKSGSVSPDFICMCITRLCSYYMPAEVAVGCLTQI
jgi:hypothetical protein